jgi:hypothetical protein
MWNQNHGLDIVRGDERESMRKNPNWIHPDLNPKRNLSPLLRSIPFRDSVMDLIRS